MNISSPFIRRPVMTTLVMLGLLIAGIISYFELAVSDLPNVERPTISVYTDYKGANPEIVLNEITLPLEKELIHVKGLQEISSRSSQGHSSIFLDFNLSKDMKDAIQEVQTAINRAKHKLPQSIDPPIYEIEEKSHELIFWMLLTSDSASLSTLRDYAQSFLTPRLSRIEGVSNVLVLGEENALTLQLNPELMTAYSTGFNEIIEAIKEKTKQLPLGSIKTGNRHLGIEWQSSLKTSQDLMKLKVGRLHTPIEEMSELKEGSGTEKIFRLITPHSKTEALVIGIEKAHSGNTVALAKEVRKALSEIKGELPQSIHLTTWFDKSTWIQEALHEVEWSLLFAVFLVFLVIYMSLGKVQEALIASASLPLSLAGTFIFLYFAGFSLDLLSLLAITLAVGFVVDDAIVVLENIVRHKEKGEDSLTASLNGSKTICFTVISMTVSLIAVFIPLLFMPGMIGRIFREFSLTLSSAIVISGFISLSLIPMLCRKYLSKPQKESRLSKIIQKGNEKLSSAYGKSLKFCFRFQKTILASLCLTTVLAFFLFSELPVSLVPKEDRGYLFAVANLSSGLVTEEINKKQQEMENILQAMPAINRFLSLNKNGTLIFLASLVPHKERLSVGMLVSEVKRALETVVGAQIFVIPYQLIDLDFDFGGSGTYKFEIQGTHLKQVEKGAEELLTALRQSPLFSFARLGTQNDSPVLELIMNEELAREYGFSEKEVQHLFLHAYGKNQIGSLQNGSIEKKIYLELMPDYQSSADAPNKLYLTSKDGHLIALRSFVDWKEKLGFPTLTRTDQLSSLTIQFSLAEGVSSNQGFSEIKKLASALFPEGVSGRLTGSAETTASTIKTTLLLLGAAILVMYIVLGMLYESFFYPIIILSSIPFAALGGVLTLSLFNETLSIFSAVGFLLLIGIIKKNGIMLVDYAVEARKAGASPENAIFEASIVRLRPILMTTFTAVMGAIPLAYGFGDSIEMRRGLGLVIVGGLLFAQLLTLYVTPVFFLIFEKARTRMTQKKILANP